MSSIIPLHDSLYDAAIRHIALTVGVVMGRKGAPCHLAVCDAVAAQVIPWLRPEQVRALALGQEMDAEAEALIRRAANCAIDLGTARTMVTIFSLAAGIDALPTEEADRLTSLVIIRLMGDEGTAHAGEQLWPPVGVMEAQAAALLPATRPLRVDAVEAALLVAIDQWPWLADPNADNYI